jgi:hypothetical protein
MASADRAMIKAKHGRWPSKSSVDLSWSLLARSGRWGFVLMGSAARIKSERGIVFLSRNLDCQDGSEREQTAIQISDRSGMK